MQIDGRQNIYCFSGWTGLVARHHGLHKHDVVGVYCYVSVLARYRISYSSVGVLGRNVFLAFDVFLLEIDDLLSEFVINVYNALVWLSVVVEVSK